MKHQVNSTETLCANVVPEVVECETVCYEEGQPEVSVELEPVVVEVQRTVPKEYTIRKLFEQIAERDPQFKLIELSSGVALETADGKAARHLANEFGKHVVVSLELCFDDIILSKNAQQIFLEMKNCSNVQFHSFKNYVKTLMNTNLTLGSQKGSLADYHMLKAIYDELKGLPLQPTTLSSFLITSYREDTELSKDQFLRCVFMANRPEVAREPIIPKEAKQATFIGVMKYLEEQDNLLVEKFDQGCRVYFATEEQESELKQILRENSHTFMAKQTPLGVVIGFYI